MPCSQPQLIHTDDKDHLMWDSISRGKNLLKHNALIRPVFTSSAVSSPDQVSSHMDCGPSTVPLLLTQSLTQCILITNKQQQPAVSIIHSCSFAMLPHTKLKLLHVLRWLSTISPAQENPKLSATLPMAAGLTLNGSIPCSLYCNRIDRLVALKHVTPSEPNHLSNQLINLYPSELHI